jgi:peptidyl-prolyl cis-trans isomerase B (cyclophilin B)
MRKVVALTLLATGLVCAQNGAAPKVYTETFAGIDSIQATIYTGYGPMVFRLYQEKTPQTVANFVELSEKKFYDGLKFHRVIPGFMAQGGDPKGDGTGGPGWTIKDEFDPALKHVPGALSMANAGPGTGGSQFFIVQVEQAHLNGKHSVFGMLRSGWDISCLIEPNDKIDSIRIHKFGKAAAAPAAVAVPAPVAKKDSAKVAAPAPVVAKDAKVAPAPAKKDSAKAMVKPAAVPAKKDSAKK